MDLVEKGVATAEDVDTAFCKGCGLRDPFIGPFMRAHLAGNNIERFFKNYDQSYRYRLESMETWTSFPRSAIDAVVKEVDIDIGGGDTITATLVTDDWSSTSA